MCSHVGVDVRAEPIVPSDSHVRCHRKFDDSNRQYPPITSEGQKWGVDVSGVPVHKRAGLHADPQHSARATGWEITHSCKVEGRGCENTRFRGAEYSAERWTRRQERDYRSRSRIGHVGASMPAGMVRSVPVSH